MLRQRLYSKDISIIRSFDDKVYKLTCFRCLRNSGLEFKAIRNYSEKGTVNDEKLEVNLRRAKAKIFELAYCNDWELFVTLTFSKDKLKEYGLSRYDMEGVRRNVLKWFKDINKRRDKKIRYLLIPEPHEDGAIHIHGFIIGLEPSEMRLFNLKEKLPPWICKRLQEGAEVFTWSSFANRYGYTAVEAVRNREAASKYITKYISKGIMESVKVGLGTHLYYHSKGLKESLVIKKGSTVGAVVPSYENEYVKVQWSKNLDELLAIVF